MELRTGTTATATGRTGRPRLDSVQVMRGVAAVVVVFAHAVDLVLLNPALGQSRIIPLGHLENFGAIGVDLFFVISGFVMALSVAGSSGAAAARRFLVLRWLRIAPPFLAACALFICLQAFAGEPHPLPWRALANAVLFVPVADAQHYTVPVIDVGWTLSFEFTFYLAVAALVALGLARRPGLLVALIVVAVGLGAWLQPGHLLLSWATNPILLEFALGIVAYQLWVTGLLDRVRPLWWALGAVGAGVLATELVVGFGTVSEAWTVLDASGSARRVLLWGLPLFLLFLALVPLGRTRGTGRAGRLARTLGDTSYSLYLVHMPVFLVLGAVLRRSGLSLPVADLVLVAAVAVAVTAGVLFHRWVEKPVNAAARRWATERRPDAPPVAAAAPVPGHATTRLPRVDVPAPPHRSPVAASGHGSGLSLPAVPLPVHRQASGRHAVPVTR
ncbi:acyltransferase family protein [Geodermatophilus sp. SYSU D01045]